MDEKSRKRSSKVDPKRTQARRQDLATGGAKPDGGVKNQEGATFLKHSIGYMQQPGDQT